MKIAVLSFKYPPETGFGGFGTYTWYQARALVKLGQQVHVLAGSPESCAHSTTVHDGVRVHRFRADDLITRAAAIFAWRGCFWTRQRIQNAWCMGSGLSQLMKHHCFDVIEMPECGAEGSLITLLLHTPTVVRFHSPSRLIMHFYGVPRGQVTILFAGRMEQRRGIHLCAEIVETILSRHDVTFLFASEDIFGYVDNTLKPALESKNLAESFRRLGKLGLKELRACARAVDIFLLPSLWEN